MSIAKKAIDISYYPNSIINLKMIIGIDEVGNFTSDSIINHFFTAILIDQNNNGHKIKEDQFLEWFSKIPNHKINKNGEIKGSDLSDEELFEFADRVIATTPLVDIVQISVIPNENPLQLVEEFKNIEIERLKSLITEYKKMNRNHIASQYEKLLFWYKNRGYAQYLKIIVLNNTICEALRTSIIDSIVLEQFTKDENLLNIKIKIDRDFINASEPKIFWNDFLKSTFRTFTEKYPIPVLDTWRDAGHPFMDKYCTKDGRIDLKEILQTNTNFYNSHEHFEIQMADIVGTIFHRFQNRKTCHAAYQRIMKKYSKLKHKWILLRLNPNPDNNTHIIFD